MAEAHSDVQVEKDRPDGPLLLTICISTVLAVIVIMFVFMGLWQRRADQLAVQRHDALISKNYDQLVSTQRNRLHSSGEDPVPAGAPEGTKPTRFVSIEDGKKAFFEKHGRSNEPR